MKPFLTTKRKTIELLIMLLVATVFYLISKNLEMVTLFCFGYIWNWAASQDLNVILENKRYRFSMLKLVTNLQSIFLRPFTNAPEFMKHIIRILPAGIFWTMVIVFNESNMPWWSTFVGSLCFEIVCFVSTKYPRPKVAIT